MTLEESAMAFFAAIHQAGQARLGHEQFAFQIDIKVMVRPEDADAARDINAQVQAAMNNASASIRPVKVSLQ